MKTTILAGVPLQSRHFPLARTVLGAIWLLADISSVPGETLINFDDAANGTVVNTRYAGVTFSNPLGGDIYARADIFAPSPGNVVSVFGTGLPEFDARWGAVQAHFATPMLTIRIDVRPVAPLEFLTPLTKRPFIQAFDAAGVYLGATYYAGALPTGVGEIGPLETLTYTSTSANIAFARFSTQNPLDGTPTYGLFDNFRFEAGVKPFISTPPGGGTVSAGSPFTLSVTAGGTAPLAYQWQQDGSSIANETNATLAWSELTPADGGAYRVVVTNLYGAVTSVVANLVVPPSLAEALDAPGSDWTTGGGSGWYRTTGGSHDGIDAATCLAPGLLPVGSPWMQTSVHGPGTVHFWWIFPGTLLTSDYLTFSVDGELVARVRMRTLALWASQTVYLGSGSHTLRWAYLKAGNYTGGPARVDQLTFTSGGTAPIVVTPPVSQMVTGGTNVDLTVEAAGTPPLAYQWQRNGADVPGATTETLTWLNVNPARAGDYRVVVTNAYGAVTSAVATLTILPGVNTAPVVGAIGDAIVHAGVTVSVSVVAEDADVPTNHLAYALLARPTGMTIDPVGGRITWVPVDIQAPSTNLVVVKVSDDASPSLSVTQQFRVTVLGRPRVVLNGLNWAFVGEDPLGNRIWRLYPELSWSAISNTQYRIFYTTNVALEDWTGMTTTNLPIRPQYVTATGTVATAAGPSVGTRVMHLFPRETVESVQPQMFYQISVRP